MEDTRIEWKEQWQQAPGQTWRKGSSIESSTLLVNNVSVLTVSSNEKCATAVLSNGLQPSKPSPFSIFSTSPILIKIVAPFFSSSWGGGGAGVWG